MSDLVKSRACIWLPLLFALLAPTLASAQDSGRVWFAQAGASGDGGSASSPIGSTSDLESASAPGDILVLIAGDSPLEGGLALKSGQTLIGISMGDRKPSITNRDGERNGGVGIVLAANVRIWNIRVESTHASGLLGINTDGVWIDGVEVERANTSASLTTAVVMALGGPIPHGGIILTSTGPDVTIRGLISGSEVTGATGAGIVSLASGGAHSRLTVSDTRVAGGIPIGYAHTGIAGIAEGPSSESDLEISDSEVSGLLSYEGRRVYEGRNIVALASADGTASVRVARSQVGESGQDGVLGAVALVPARVDVQISNSVVEGAGQSNVEGTILNLPPFDPSRADEAHVSVRVENSTLRQAGASDAFEGQRTNVYLGSSPSAQQLDPTSTTPFSAGSYQLEVRDSRVEGALDYGVIIGFGGSVLGIAPEGATFDIVLRDNEILSNGSGELVLRAPHATVDARQNCWGTNDGLSEDRLLLEETTERSQVDAAEPLACETAESE